MTEDRDGLKFAAEELWADRDFVLAVSFVPFYAERVPLYERISMNLWGDREITLRLIDTYKDDLPLTLVFCFVQKYSNLIV